MKRKAGMVVSSFAVLILAAGLAVAAVNFTGTWQTGWGPLTMTQRGNKVTGTYGGQYPGKLEGVVTGNRLNFTWIGKNGERGRGYFDMAADNKSFFGMWGSGNSETNGGAWNGTRVR